MLKFKIVENEQGKLVYRYYPEGNEDFGEVSYDEKTGICSIEILANNDRHKRYALKMMSRIRAMKANGTFEAEGMVAWY